MKAMHYTEMPAQDFPGVPGVTVRWLIGKKEGAPNFAFRVFDMHPGAVVPPHNHDWEHEVFVLAGNGIVRVDDEERHLKEGDFVFIPPNAKHQFINDSGEIFRFICVIPLKGDMRE